MRQFFSCGNNSLNESRNCSSEIISFYINKIIFITPAFLIFIWGLPTFHWIAGINSFFITCSAIGFNAYFIVPSLNKNSISTKVSILNSNSLWGFIMYSITCKISGKNFTTSPWQFLTIVSNLNLSFEVFVQFTYCFVPMNFYKIGRISFEWSSDTFENPDFKASCCIKVKARSLNSWLSVLVAWTLRTIEKRTVMRLWSSNLWTLCTITSAIPKTAWSPSSLS